MALRDLLNQLFGQPEEARMANSEERRRLAAAVLLVEIAQSDFHLHDAELSVIEQVLSSEFDLPSDVAGELLEAARREHAGHTSLHPYVSVMNEHGSIDEKRRLLEALWRVAHADGVLDSHEEHMMRRIAELLFLSHADFIQTKLRVQAAT